MDGSLGSFCGCLDIVLFRLLRFGEAKVPDGARTMVLGLFFFLPLPLFLCFFSGKRVVGEKIWVFLSCRQMARFGGERSVIFPLGVTVALGVL